jgi:hypothetical protein
MNYINPKCHIFTTVSVQMVKFERTDHVVLPSSPADEETTCTYNNFCVHSLPATTKFISIKLLAAMGPISSALKQ